LYYCKLCNADVKIGKMHHSARKQVLLKYKICLTCLHKINKSYNTHYHWIPQNPYTICVMCRSPTRPHSAVPVCSAQACRSKWYRLVLMRKRIQTQLKNGGFKDHHLRVFSIKELGFEVQIITKPDDQTFIKGIPLV